MIYFTSDTHFGHANIIKYCNRPFKSVIEMDDTLIKKWNDVVKEDDIIYHLGDFALGSRTFAREITQKLNGKKYLVMGNHDRWNASFYEKIGFTVLKNQPIILSELGLALSHRPTLDSKLKGCTNIFGHIHEKKLEDLKDAYDPRLYSLDKHINVSVDVWDFKPVSLERIKSLL